MCKLPLILVWLFGPAQHCVNTVNPIKLETGLRTINAGIPSPLFLRFEAIGFPTFGLLL